MADASAAGVAAGAAAAAAVAAGGVRRRPAGDIAKAGGRQERMRMGFVADIRGSDMEPENE